MADSPIVKITDVIPGSEEIGTRDLAVGMAVFDVFGNEYVLDKVRHHKRGCRIFRSDGCSDWFEYGTTITVRR